MLDWLVGGAVLVDADDLLLVRNRRRDGSFDWTPPGGVIDETDGSITDGIAREVAEETGLRVTEWSRLTTASTVTGTSGTVPPSRCSRIHLPRRTGSLSKLVE